MNAPLFCRPAGIQTRWTSFENIAAAKGAGAMENQGVKGHSCDSIEPGGAVSLLDAKGAGVIRRIWLTISDRSPLMLRGLRFECYWDDEESSAISVPLGDFFGISLGRRVPFESELFSDPEGRSFLCHIPMPFRKGARITLTNDTRQRLDHLFFDVNYEVHPTPAAEWLYLHAIWRRENPTTLGVDYTILPKVHGTGRFLGLVCGAIVDKRYRSWFGEGEVKIYLDGDDKFPTLVGTGLEDYVGDAWGLNAFAHRYSGAPVCDAGASHYSFYRWHVADPVYFDKDIRVTIQQIGACSGNGSDKEAVQGLPHRFTLWDRRSLGGTAHKLLEEPGMIGKPASEMNDGGIHYYRVDDYSSCAYLYLDRARNEFPPLASLTDRMAGLMDSGEGRNRADL